MKKIMFGIYTLLLLITSIIFTKDILVSLIIIKISVIIPLILFVYCIYLGYKASFTNKCTRLNAVIMSSVPIITIAIYELIARPYRWGLAGLYLYAGIVLAIVIGIITFFAGKKDSDNTSLALAMGNISALILTFFVYVFY